MATRGAVSADRGQTAGRGHGSLAKVTVNLTPRALQALGEVAEITGDSKTDTINRALQLYAFVEKTIAKGGSVHLRESADSELQQIRFF
ncbi:hypothetical protein [Saccharopolyspora spinosa]|uniref:Uncharacterized protein n=1 Tax=Saccharopolyspora spinosa TaxID=60894 RepID=A0A2N3Y6T1_SACSN|nr:hypothetical protein [Saccharopolyspora spinosa]PKW18603.1 hypothetical protein A8926_6705 [Saccharopolyspora spinosa]